MGHSVEHGIKHFPWIISVNSLWWVEDDHLPFQQWFNPKGFWFYWSGWGLGIWTLRHSPSDFNVQPRPETVLQTRELSLHRSKSMAQGHIAVSGGEVQACVIASLGPVRLILCVDWKSVNTGSWVLGSKWSVGIQICQRLSQCFFADPALFRVWARVCCEAERLPGQKASAPGQLSRRACHLPFNSWSMLSLAASGSKETRTNVSWLFSSATP